MSNLAKKCQAANPATCTDPRCPEKVYLREESKNASDVLTRSTNNYYKTIALGGDSAEAYAQFVAADKARNKTVEGVIDLQKKVDATPSDTLEYDKNTIEFRNALEDFADRNYNGNLVEAKSALERYEGSYSSASTSTPAEPVTIVDPSAPVDSTDPRVQAGEVLNEVVVDGVAFSRRRAGVFPNTPYSMRIQLDRPISDDEMNRIAGLIGYNYRATIAGESLDYPHRDSPYSFVVGSDMTKSQRDDLGMALDDFEENLPNILANGSPIRKTDRSGAGTKGTQLVEGFGDDLKYEIYYDDTHKD